MRFVILASRLPPTQKALYSFHEKDGGLSNIGGVAKFPRIPRDYATYTLIADYFEDPSSNPNFTYELELDVNIDLSRNPVCRLQGTEVSMENLIFEFTLHHGFPSNKEFHQICDLVLQQRKANFTTKVADQKYKSHVVKVLRKIYRIQPSDILLIDDREDKNYESTLKDIRKAVKSGSEYYDLCPWDDEYDPDILVVAQRTFKSTGRTEIGGFLLAQEPYGDAIYIWLLCSNRNVGRVLLDRFVQYCQTIGVRIIRLHYSEGASKFYASYGFKHDENHGDHNVMIFDVPEDSEDESDDSGDGSDDDKSEGEESGPEADT
jgi:GNAT superfamily N-acetyltransferase